MKDSLYSTFSPFSKSGEAVKDKLPLAFPRESIELDAYCLLVFVLSLTITFHVYELYCMGISVFVICIIPEGKLTLYVEPIHSLFVSESIEAAQ